MWDDDEDEPDQDDRLVRRVDEMLPVLLAPMIRAASGRRLERILAAEQDLRRCLEACAERLLTTGELDLLPFEQAVEPDGAVARVASVDVLLLALPFFLREPEWYGADREDRRVRTRVADLIAHTIPTLPELRGYSCGAEVWSVEYAIEDARRAMRRPPAPRS